MRSLSTNQAQKEQILNENFLALLQGQVFGWKVQSTTGLQYGYWGGRFQSSTGALSIVNDGVITLPANTTSYVYFNLTTQLVATQTTVPGSGIRIAQVTTDATKITTVVDERVFSLIPVGLPPSLQAGNGASVATNETFKAITITGLVVTITGGKWLWSTAFTDSSASGGTASQTNITLPASQSGYIYLNASGTISSMTGTQIWDKNYLPLYYYVTSSSGVTTLEDVRNSFKNYSARPVDQYYLTNWAIGTEYSKNISTFKDGNRSGVGTNIFPQGLQLYCKTAELGYSAGDLTTPINNSPSVTVRTGTLIITTSATLPQVMVRTAGSVGTLATITLANWGIVVDTKPAQ